MYPMNNSELSAVIANTEEAIRRTNSYSGERPLLVEHLKVLLTIQAQRARAERVEIPEIPSSERAVIRRRYGNGGLR